MVVFTQKRVQSDNDNNAKQRIIKDKNGNDTNVRPTNDTAGAATILAHASRVYAKYDSAYAHKCLKAAKVHVDISRTES